MKKLPAVFAFLTIAFVACVSYDAPVIYHRNFQPGTHDSLRFDGYYAQEGDWILYGQARSMFLFRDGSVWFGEKRASEIDFRSGFDGISHSWGNYKIDADTIYVERFHRAQDSDNYNRITLKGIVGSQKIRWLLRSEDRMNPDSVFYASVFQPFDKKPDSTQNWTRTREQFNK